jgi:hypothetical protein
MPGPILTVVVNVLDNVAYDIIGGCHGDGLIRF